MRATLLAAVMMLASGCPKARSPAQRPNETPFVLAVNYDSDGSFQGRPWSGATGNAELLVHPGVYLFCDGEPATRHAPAIVSVHAVINRTLVARSDFPMDVVCPLSTDVPVRLTLRELPIGPPPPLAAVALAVPDRPDADGSRTVTVTVPNRTGLQLQSNREIAPGVRLRCEAMDPTGSGEITVRLEADPGVPLDAVPTEGRCHFGTAGVIEVTLSVARQGDP